MTALWTVSVPALGLFRDGIAGGHDIGVVAGAASQRVGSTVPGQHVVGGIPRSVDVAGAGQRQILHVRAERERHGALHEIDAFARILRHRITGAIDDVGVVACAARHAVRAGPTAEHIGAAIAGQHIGERVPGAVDGRRTRQRQIFDVACPV